MPTLSSAIPQYSFDVGSGSEVIDLDGQRVQNDRVHAGHGGVLHLILDGGGILGFPGERRC